MTMSSFVSTVYRDLLCVAAATAITLVVGLAFVQSTSVVRTSAPMIAAAATAPVAHV
jgi:hypothetical protein